MEKYRLPNPDNNEWLNKCNEVIRLNENNVQLKKSDPNYVKYSLHHILPRFEYPELEKDKKNHLYLPVMDHINLHYLMWKANSLYCAAFWWCYVYFHKNFGYNITDDELVKLKDDMKKYRKYKKENGQVLEKKL